MAKTYNALFLAARRRLRDEGIEAAAFEARELLCAATGKSREALLRDLALYPQNELEARLDALVARRIAGEPLAYILGQWEFYALNLVVNSQVLIPRPDTELLVDRAVYHLEGGRPDCRVLDLCAGSGCVGIAVAAALPDCRVVFLERSPEALSVCRENLQSHRLGSRVAALSGDALENPDPGLRDFDLICCNPPYIPSGDLSGLERSVRDYEPREALDGGADGLDYYRAIAPLWRETLRPGGCLLFEVGVDQAEDVCEILEAAGYVEVATHNDLAGRQRVVEGRVPWADSR